MSVGADAHATAKAKHIGATRAQAKVNKDRRNAYSAHYRNWGDIKDQVGKNLARYRQNGAAENTVKMFEEALKKIDVRAGEFTGSAPPDL